MLKIKNQPDYTRDPASGAVVFDNKQKVADYKRLDTIEENILELNKKFDKIIELLTK